MGGGGAEHSDDVWLLRWRLEEAEGQQPAPEVRSMWRLEREGNEAAGHGQWSLAEQRFRAAGEAAARAAAAAAEPDEAAALLVAREQYGERAEALREKALEASAAKTGAAVGGAGLGIVLGSLVGAPLLGGLGGLVAGRVLADSESTAGERARELGRAVASGARRGHEMSERHGVPGKVSDIVRAVEHAASGLWRSVAQVEQRHDLSGKAAQAAHGVAEAVGAGARKAAQLDDEYRVTERAAQAASAGVHKVAQLEREFRVSERLLRAASDTAEKIARVTGYEDEQPQAP
jgi:hypothetical protein